MYDVIRGSVLAVASSILQKDGASLELLPSLRISRDG